MMTREEILSIEEYCAEHKISHKKRLEELGIPFWHFYKAKQKYRRADEQDAQPGQFIQLASGRYDSVPSEGANRSRQCLALTTPCATGCTIDR
ncbi:MAG: hypothetical protein IJ307_08950 [Bacteroidales bacterium]|nr:hypothetical protein [Bacteroidales bacterium]